MADGTAKRALALHNLPDDIIARIRKATIPNAGLLVTPSCYHKRQAYLQQLGIKRTSTQFGHDDREDEAWRVSLADLETPAGLKQRLLEHPPWASGAIADRLYDATRGLSALVVCKRWHALFKGASPPKVAICGMGEKPPSHTEVLVLAALEPWTNPSTASELAYLTELPSLRALVFCCLPAAEDWPNEAGDPHGRGKMLTLPSVPQGLTQLRHVMYTNAREFVFPFTMTLSTKAVVDSFLPLAGLSTLSLGRRLSTDFAEMFRAMPRLQTLFMRSTSNVLRQCASLTALRALKIGLADGDAPFDVSVLSTVSTLSSLCLVRNTYAIHLVGVQRLTQLKALNFDGIHPDDIAAELAPLTALTTLTILSEHNNGFPFEDDSADAAADMALVTSLASVPALPPLTLRSMKSNGDVSGLSKLTTLVNLELAMAQLDVALDDDDDALAVLYDVKNVSTLSTLTRLTALRLASCSLVNGGCAAVASMTQLQELHLSHTRVPDPGALRALTGLRELLLQGKLWERDAEAWLAAMRLSATCPGLQRLAVLSSSPEHPLRLQCVSGLSNLEFLRLRGTPVTDASLEQLRSLRALQFLDLTESGVVSEAGLRHLLSCESLRSVAAEVHAAAAGSLELKTLAERGVLVRAKVRA